MTLITKLNFIKLLLLVGRLDVDTAFNLAKRSTVAATYNLPGATHGDEHFYTFGYKRHNSPKSISELFNMRVGFFCNIILALLKAFD